MRGRGGRGGRYGGRSSATQELIRDNLEDLGFDSTAIEDRSAGGPPPLYPPPTNNLCSVLLNPPIPDSEHKYAIDKTMEFSKRCFQSPYNLDNFINHNNVYNNYPNNTNNNANSNNKVPKELLELICQGKDEDYPYVPEELINGTNKKIFNVIKKRDVDLRRFEEAEEGKTEGGNIRNYDGENKNEEEEEDNDNMELEQDELELDDDYIVDHNESEDEDDNDNEGAIY